MNPFFESIADGAQFNFINHPFTYKMFWCCRELTGIYRAIVLLAGIKFACFLSPFILSCSYNIRSQGKLHIRHSKMIYLYKILQNFVVVRRIVGGNKKVLPEVYSSYSCSGILEECFVPTLPTPRNLLWNHS